MQPLYTFLNYFFEPLPTGPFQYRNGLIALVIITLLVSIALRVYLKKQREDKILRKLFRDLPGKLQGFAITEAIYLAVRYEHMQYLSMRILHFLILAYGVYTVLKAAQSYLKTYPAGKKHRDHQMKLNQYLPRKKK